MGGAAGVHTTAVSLPLSSNIKSVLPSPGQVVGVAHPVVVTFNAPISDRPAAEHAIALSSTPALTGKFDWLDNKVVQWVPDGFWPAHSTVKLTVEGKPTAFETGPAVVGVASISQHTFTVTVDGASPEDLPSPHHLPHAGEPGVLLASLGSPEYSTPVGHYTVLSKDRSVVMDSSSVGIPLDAPDGYRLAVDYAVRISSRGLYVHSAPWAVNAMGFQNTSHGCISLSPAAAEWYFNNVNVGDPVIVQE
ncbi:L,D-transpeptidase [Mycobacterium sp. OTB74]|jgi:lipoprotein-anchoring transpeptidase ErfK/SrfK|uniref:L,D-transpeptidase n=1 Tax=Mycobacterium sp. OTB74 TaxID=1853452 RepID=UPI002475C39A|nr:L,D-transpeptidase [Mycobacterium sp. OTB74]MDH6247502.1 lipoprotein-anchoring transpeptidase ErfK/SrfK [Mycobacterium sp. OTB74]